MAIVPFFLACFVLSHLQLHFVSAEKPNESQISCPKLLDCGKIGPIRFPFSNSTYPQCGLCTVNCDHPLPQIQLGNEGPWFDAEGISIQSNGNKSGLIEVKIHDQMLQSHLDNKNCLAFSNLTFPSSPSISFTISNNLTFFKCNKSCEPNCNRTLKHFRRETCEGFDLFYKHQAHQQFLPSYLRQCCSVVQLPMNQSKHLNRNTSNLFELLTATFFLQLHLSKDCIECRHREGQCQDHNQTFRCPQMRKKEETTPDSHTSDKIKFRLILATVVIGSFILMICLPVFIVYRCKRWNHLSKNPNSNPPFNADSGRTMSTMFFGVPLFSYSELEQATNNFDPSKELGDGGFGTVYHGKLQDGREVAVKRLYEHNCKRMSQFLNEVEILTRLDHQNLVSLYGCTSRHSRELLLVCEYIPNGTVADHLHGDRAKYGLLTWPIRMNIALETASALSYLHASDIIHRDVKSSNILLDNSYSVKVADFGISRVFPTDVSHVSTAPQGTPGYVDPEYHRCYQLTNKSDVYSFGVVLIELISSMPAIDINRHRHEINLADLAINRIQTRPLNELIDPSLGSQSDSSIERMTSSVAEVAFQFLQYEREMRPTMDEVLEALKEIHDYKDDNNGEYQNTREEHESNFVHVTSI